MKQLSSELPIMKYPIFEQVLGVLSSKNWAIPGVPWFIMISCGVTPCHYRAPLPLCHQECTMSTRYWMRQPHRPYHTSRHNSILISASLQLNSSAYNILIYRYFSKTLSTATHYCDRMLIRCIFIEFPGGTVVTHGNCFLRSLRTQQKDEIQRNVSRDKQYIPHEITGRVCVGLLHFTLCGWMCCCTFIQVTITRYKSAWENRYVLLPKLRPKEMYFCCSVAGLDTRHSADLLSDELGNRLGTFNEICSLEPRDAETFPLDTNGVFHSSAFNIVLWMLLCF
jgi:hypothetical protein